VRQPPDNAHPSIKRILADNVKLERQLAARQAIVEALGPLSSDAERVQLLEDVRDLIQRAEDPRG
jgi:hypothetical protein